jgi:hypothetical protein
MAPHALLPRHAKWRCKKGLVRGNTFADNLLFKFVSSLGYFCLNCRVKFRNVVGGWWVLFLFRVSFSWWLSAWCKFVEGFDQTFKVSEGAERADAAVHVPTAIS